MAFGKPTHPLSATPTEALGFMASVCDGARRSDSLGFGRDEQDAHQLLAKGESNWTFGERRRALWIIRYYRRQLTTAGFNVDQILRRKPIKISKRRFKKLPPALWYADPNNFAAHRLHNGVRWTGVTDPPHVGGTSPRFDQRQRA